LQGFSLATLDWRRPWDLSFFLFSTCPRRPIACITIRCKDPGAGTEKIGLFFFLWRLRIRGGRTIRTVTSCLEPTTNGLLSGSDPGKVDVRFLLPWSGLICIVLPGAGGFLDYLFCSSSGGIRADSGQQGEFRTDCVYIQFSVEILPVSFLALRQDFLLDPTYVAFSSVPPDLMPGHSLCLFRLMLTSRFLRSAGALSQLHRHLKACSAGSCRLWSHRSFVSFKICHGIRNPRIAF